VTPNTILRLCAPLFTPLESASGSLRHQSFPSIPIHAIRDHESRSDRLSLGTIIVAASGTQIRGLEIPSAVFPFRVFGVFRGQEISLCVLCVLCG
jgi:hypothetical protein